jgi:hypothetical protein
MQISPFGPVLPVSAQKFSAARMSLRSSDLFNKSDDRATEFKLPELGTQVKAFLQKDCVGKTLKQVHGHEVAFPFVFCQTIALGLVVLGFLADHTSQLHRIALSILLVLMTMLFVMACTQSIDLSPQAQGPSKKRDEHVQIGLYLQQVFRTKIGSAARQQNLLQAIASRFGKNELERMEFVLVMRELFYMPDELAVRMHSSLANGNRCVQISFMKKVLEDHSHEKIGIPPFRYQQHIVTFPDDRAVFGWGGQRHKATNRQAEQASPRNPTKKSRLT